MECDKEILEKLKNFRNFWEKYYQSFISVQNSSLFLFKKNFCNNFDKLKYVCVCVHV